jgi:hypothetical protein
VLSLAFESADLVLFITELYSDNFVYVASVSGAPDLLNTDI